MHEYLVPAWEAALKPAPEAKAAPLERAAARGERSRRPSTAPPSSISAASRRGRIPATPIPYYGAKGKAIGQAGLGNRKDIRNAVEAAAKASGWSSATAHNRAQVLYYIAENLSARAEEFAARLKAMGQGARDAKAEVEAALARIFWYAAQADKYDGRVHATKSRHVTLAMNEPCGVMGLVCPDEMPLLGFVSLVMPAIAMGNRVVAVPSPRQPLAATDLYQVFDTSDVPGGVVNIVTGERDELAKTLAEHDEVAALWYFGAGGVSDGGGRECRKPQAHLGLERQARATGCRASRGRAANISAAPCR